MHAEHDTTELNESFTVKQNYVFFYVRFLCQLIIIADLTSLGTGILRPMNCKVL